MDRKHLERKLNSVGKRVFVEQFTIFKNFASGQIDRSRAIKALVNQGVSNNPGAGIRVGNAKLIFEARQERAALEIILRSGRMSSSVLTEARRLREQLA
jgi:hypothetical protein